MRIGILGAGTLARSFAQKAIAAGHTVTLSGSRAPDVLEKEIVAEGIDAKATTIDVAATMPIVLLAVPWPQVENVLGRLGVWDGQVLIDATNAFRDGTPTSGIVDFKGGSSSETVASLAKGAHVVKAMNSLFMSNFVKAPETECYRRVILISGDNEAAKETVADLYESLGFAPIDLGSIEVGGRMQQAGGPIAGHDLFVPWPAPRTLISKK